MNKITLAPNEKAITFSVSDSGRKAWNNKSSICVYGGPAGTGKTRTWCERLNALAAWYPGVRFLMARQFRSTMTSTCIETFKNEVLKPEDGVRWNGQDQKWIYPYKKREDKKYKRVFEGVSELWVTGLDDMKKAMSSQYDIIYVNEITDILKPQLEYLVTRNRNRMNSGMPWNQVVGDFNPVHPGHWLKAETDLGNIDLIWSSHKDNPRIWNVKCAKCGVFAGQLHDDSHEFVPGDYDWTEEGYDYVFNKLGVLTGARRARLLEGKWAAEEGAVYDTFDRGVHVCANFVPPFSWRRLWVIDFGYVNPFVWQNWAIDPDGFRYLHQELYLTNLLVADAADLIRKATVGQPWPDAIICDHDRTDRATFEKASGLLTVKAYKDVEPGIQAVKRSLELVYDGRNLIDGKDIGRPMLNFMEDTLIHEPDKNLIKQGKPTKTIDEIPGYAWDTKQALEKQKGDVPIKLNDHGSDCVRYLEAFEQDLAVDPQDPDDEMMVMAEHPRLISAF